MGPPSAVRRDAGPTTLLGFHKALLTHPCFVRGETCHGLVESEELAARARELAASPASRRTAEGGLTRQRLVLAEVDGRRFQVTLRVPEPPYAELARRRRDRDGDTTGGSAGHEAVVSPMQGIVLAVEVADGDEVREGQVICIIEAMKMENEIAAHRRGIVSGLSVQAGAQVRTGQVICTVGREAETTPPVTPDAQG